MGETAPKQMRGGGMEDVIFNGTDARAARNVAEVALLLDNAERTAPTAFNEDEEIEISRRIERGEGSSYRVNGRDVRARDVQYLFADFATGAHSSALVGQGRISDIINAKPAQRRGILEEAAGISGLHARRHEAELRLRAAETNLERLEDVVGALETQHQALKRQSRQANRYRRIAENLKMSEALLLHIRWGAARDAEKIRAAELARETKRVGELTSHAAAAATAQSKAAAAIPDLRQKEAVKAAALQRLAVARDRLEEDERQTKEQRQTIKTRLAQIEEDLQRETTLAEDAENAMATIIEQRQKLIQAGEEAAEVVQNAKANHSASAADVAVHEERIAHLMEAVAANEAERATLSRHLKELGERERLSTERKAKAEREHAELTKKSDHRSTITQAEEAVVKARKAAQIAREAHRQSETGRETAASEESTARDQLQAYDAKLSRLHAEAQALTDLLGHGLTREGPGVVDSLEVEPGFEAALGAALGEDLEAPEDTDAAIHWTALAPLDSNPTLPGGIKPLAGFVRGPAVLARRLTQIGVVESDGEGNQMQSELGPGQRLVSKDGGMWRWDGFTIGASAPTAAANRLKQRNRLSDLELELSSADNAKREAQQVFEETRAKREEAAAQASKRRSAAESAEETLNQARDQLAALTAEAVAESSRLSALHEVVERITDELSEITRLAKETRTALGAAQSLEGGRAELNSLRDEMVNLRAIHEERSQAHHRLSGEAAQRTRRQEELSRDEAGWSDRVTGARQRLAALAVRQEEANQQLEALAKRPAEIASLRAGVLDQITTAETARNQASDALARSEKALALCDETLKEAERTTAQAREERVRIEGLMEQAKQAVEMVVGQIRERLSCTPEETMALASFKEGGELPEAEAVEARIQRLTRERENIGAVNLRAEEEAADLDEQIATLVSERTDLEAAIARLRQGIQSLNRDGRQRVTTAFRSIDGHFRSLFTRLYGGGHARLELIESDDPLEAGLEILASPPGKKLQSLTLLSGGEKALTALALLFAVFLTNPAPVCVLDEVDAPLDDSNVDRFCSLVAELAEKSGTRFIVVTHHRMTMSRVDRLYGVTMVERGVSQLVSVDLSEAERWRQSA